MIENQNNLCDNYIGSPIIVAFTFGGEEIDVALMFFNIVVGVVVVV